MPKVVGHDDKEVVVLDKHEIDVLDNVEEIVVVVDCHCHRPPGQYQYQRYPNRRGPIPCIVNVVRRP